MDIKSKVYEALNQVSEKTYGRGIVRDSNDNKVIETDYGFDSLDIIEVLIVLENEYGIELGNEIPNGTTVQGLCDIVEQAISKKS